MFLSTIGIGCGNPNDWGKVRHEFRNLAQAENHHGTSVSRSRSHAYSRAPQYGPLPQSLPFCIMYMHSIASHKTTARSDGGKPEACVNGRSGFQ